MFQQPVYKKILPTSKFSDHFQNNNFENILLTCCDPLLIEMFYNPTNTRMINILNLNPCAAKILIKNNKITWPTFAANQSDDAIPIIEKYLEENVSTDRYLNNKNNIYEVLMHACGNLNPKIIPIIEKYIKQIGITANHSHNCWRHLSGNENAIPLLKRHMSDGIVDWKMMPLNKHAADMFRNYYYACKNEKVAWNWLCSNENPDVIKLLEEHPSKISWNEICLNPNAVELLKKNVDKLNPYVLAQNRNPEMVQILEENIEKYMNDSQIWVNLSYNPAGVSLLEKYPEKIYWNILSKNKNAISILEQNPDKISWEIILNPNAIHIIEKRLDKLCYSERSLLFENPNIVPQYVNPYEKTIDLVHNFTKFVLPKKTIHSVLENHRSPIFSLMFHYTYDYNKMRENMSAFAEELASVVFHPSRMMRLCETYGLDLEELIELY